MRYNLLVSAYILLAIASQADAQQVSVEVQIVELALPKLLATGLDLQSTPLGEFVPQTQQENQPHRDHARFRLLDDSKGVSRTINLLRSHGLAKVLAEPTLITAAGRSATYFSGGQFPVPVNAAPGGEKVSYREFGTRLEVLPVLLPTGSVRLDLRPTISELDLTTSLQVDGQMVPGLRVRSLDTSVELKPGQTLVFAGGIQNKTQDAGARQDSRTLKSEETQLIILVTVRIFEAQQPDGGSGNTLKD
jgi:pilus assembly protein CpaC